MDSAETATEQRRATVSQIEQWDVQDKVFNIYNAFATIPSNARSLMLEIQRDKHMEYLIKGLRQLGPSFVVLDANRPWLCYWILHSIALLGECIDDELEDNAIDFLHCCQDPNGGYGGGPGQLPHLATTYAAVNSLVTLGGEKAFLSIKRNTLYSFLWRMKDPSGAFRMHDNGEIDVRACYTAISVASILNILDDELIRDVGNYIVSCQTYEGGISGEPGSEAHGGYTFCGLATMILINEVHRLDLARLIDWVVFRQGVEGGFQGRTNKLVDGCYSFWQGGVCALLQSLNLVGGEQSSDDQGESDTYVEPLFHSMALQQYVLLCSQEQLGGFRDKPGKARDFYHTCYCLSGLSTSQYSWSKGQNSPPLPRAVMGPHSNLLERIHPLYNVIFERYDEAHEYFSRS